MTTEEQLKNAPEYIKNRLAICADCDHMRYAQIGGARLCGLCGCVLVLKARIKGTNCPDNKWPAVK